MKLSIILSATAFLVAGCATMIRGTREPLQLSSNPEGAEAQLSNGQSCTTPCSIDLPRETSVAVNFTKDGCDSQTVSVFPTLAGAGVILGGVIDYGTGAVYNLQPNPVIAGLHCHSVAQAAPPAIAAHPVGQAGAITEPTPAVSQPGPTASNSAAAIVSAPSPQDANRNF
jgi:hypothetical protein